MSASRLVQWLEPYPFGYCSIDCFNTARDVIRHLHRLRLRQCRIIHRVLAHRNLNHRLLATDPLLTGPPYEPI